MPPETRSQKTREAVAASDAPPSTAIADEQQSSSLRLRKSASKQSTGHDSGRRSIRSNVPDEPPRFVIDLSLPPEQRYLEVCAAFKSEMSNMTALFDEVVGDMVQFLPNKVLHFVCRACLRSVYDKEENAELKGISKGVGVPMYLLICFNVLLDLFMGCSSGGAAVRSGSSIDGGSKMVHFRTLDWGMPELRRIVVHLDYTLEKDGPIIASSITYAGYVGVLTGVRQGLSMSLNFRPNRIDNGKFWPDKKYQWHLLLVLLGKRPSISTTLRRFLLPKSDETRRHWWSPLRSSKDMHFPSYADIVERVGRGLSPATTACYFCFCDGNETTVVEKDRISAKSRSSEEFILVTNSDEDPPITRNADVLQEMIEEAKDRQQCARTNWSNMRYTKLKRTGLDISYNGEDLRALMEVDDVVELVQQYPTTNECTHFACVLDPSEGTVRWCRRWLQPVTAEYVREFNFEINQKE